MLFSLFPQILELIIPVNNKVVNQNPVELDYVGLDFGQSLLVDIALKTVWVVILLEHFEVPLGQPCWDSLEVGYVLINLHHKLILFIHFMLFVDCGIFSQDLLVHPTCCGGHYSVVVSHLQVAHWQCLTCWILAVEWVQCLGHWVLTLRLSNCLSSSVVLRRA